MNVLRVTFLSALVLEMVGTISTALIAVQIGLRLLRGDLFFEQAFFILLLAPEFYLPLRLLGQRFHAGANGIQAARRIFALLNTPGLPEPVDSGISAVQKIQSPKLIRFENVSYTYPGQAHPAVEGVSFQLERDQMTALVGATGSGKSTLANLLLRFSLPTSGQVKVDGMLEAKNSLSRSVPRNPRFRPYQVIFQTSIA